MTVNCQRARCHTLTVFAYDIESVISHCSRDSKIATVNPYPIHAPNVSTNSTAKHIWYTTIHAVIHDSMLLRSLK